MCLYVCVCMYVYIHIHIYIYCFYLGQRQSQPSALINYLSIYEMKLLTRLEVQCGLGNSVGIEVFFHNFAMKCSNLNS